MMKDKFLTIRWNNWLTLALGLPALIYVIASFSTPAWSTKNGLIILSIIGVVYWLVIENHTAMRFAWLREKETETTVQGQISNFSLIRIAYNLVFWIFLIPFLSNKIDYGFGFIAFAIVILIRLALNLYTNNLLKQTPEQYERFPFRP